MIQHVEACQLNRIDPLDLMAVSAMIAILSFHFLCSPYVDRKMTGSLAQSDCSSSSQSLRLIDPICTSHDDYQDGLELYSDYFRKSICSARCHCELYD